jgi:uncharacterized membrane protein
MRLIAAYFTSFIVFLAVDAVIIFSFGARSYRNTLQDVLAQDIKIAPAVLFYLLFCAGRVCFAVVPGLEAGQWRVAALKGALYGLFTYAKFALTCYAAIRNWTFQLAATDLCGGTMISCATAIIAALVAMRF